ncbi:MAG: pilus assembly protein PilM [Labilithrix sp.]|nr:pilus assembly protein PilM [Labilithrix sp.]MCW5813566.1 pilus assembly protein PilM [Labilithrix sp.]
MSTFLGVDIGTTAVKVAAIRTAYRKVQLIGLANVEIAQAGGVNEAIGMAVRSLMGESKHLGDAIAIALPGARATVKMVGLPASAQKQIGEVLPFELEASLPFDLAEAVFDYRVLPGMREKKGEELSVLVGVAKTADVVTRIDLLKNAIGVEPERVGVGAFPIANLLPHVSILGEGVCAIVDLGTVSSDLIILANGEPVFARTIGMGTKGLPGTAAKLARELRTTIASHRAQGGEAPSRLYLCGGGAYVSGAEAFLSSALEITVERLPPPMIEAPAMRPEQGATIARFAMAIGLALGLQSKAIGFNLRKGPLAFERGLSWIKERVPLLAGLAAVILVSFLFSAWAQLYAKSKERAVLEAALATVTKEVLGEETSDATRAKELLASQTAINDEDPLPHADAWDVMLKLSEHIPKEITSDIEELDLQKNHVVVHGVVGTVADAETIRTNLKSERCFTEPKITRTDQAVGAENRKKYVLEFDLRCPEDQKGGEKKKPGSAGASASASAAPAGGK